MGWFHEHKINHLTIPPSYMSFQNSNFLIHLPRNELMSHSFVNRVGVPAQVKSFCKWHAVHYSAITPAHLLSRVTPHFQWKSRILCGRYNDLISNTIGKCFWIERPCDLITTNDKSRWNIQKFHLYRYILINCDPNSIIVIYVWFIVVFEYILWSENIDGGRGVFI